MATAPLHILLVNNYTGRGGIPKSIAGIANAMAARGHKVSIISQRPVPRLLYPLYRFGTFVRRLSLDPGQRAPLPLGTRRLEEMYPLRPGIRVLPYCFSDKNLKIQALRERLRRLDPDVCVCPLPDGSQLVWAATLMGTGIPYVYSERISPRAMETLFWTRKGRLAAMSGADAIHLLLPGYRNSLPEFLASRVSVIPNPVGIPERPADVVGPAQKTLLWLSRLQDESKQCTLALDAFARLADKFPDWRMVIAGDGPDAKKIHAHAGMLGLSGRVTFAGNVDDTERLFLGAQAFCFSSRHEGMPNALLEAMAAGLPCAAFAGCDGLSDILRHNENGLLAEEMSAEALAASLETLMGSPGLRARLGKGARASLAAYSSGAVYDAWEKLLRETAACKGSTVMDAFREEPFASLARMSSRARQEWAGRDFGEPMPDALRVRLKAFVAQCAGLCAGHFRRKGRARP